MTSRQNFAGIDGFRMAAAFLVVAIHTAPFARWNITADFLFSYCLARVAVPFFLMTTGYFILAPYAKEVCRAPGKGNFNRLHRYLRRILLLYGAAILLYLPVRLYAGSLPAGPWAILKDLIFDGTFYHLWYLPALITGCLLVCFLVKKLGMHRTGICVFLLYLTGLLGDSYYGLSEMVPPLQMFFRGVFFISTYTRNGVFYVPIFLYLGMKQAGRAPRAKVGQTVPALLTFLILMLAEGFLTYRFDLQHHNSMYLFLIPCSVYLFELLRSVPGHAPKSFRNASLWIYLIHPLVIVVVRGIAKATGTTAFFVTNNFIHFLTVSAVSALTALPVLWILNRKDLIHVFQKPRLD